MNIDKQKIVGRVSDSVTRQAEAGSEANVGLRSANPTYKAEFSTTTLGEILNFSNGKSSPERFENGKCLVFGANGAISRANETNSPSNSIIVGRVGSYCGAVHFSIGACWVTDNAIKATAKDDNDPSFLYYLLKQLNLNNWRSGSGQPLINQSTLNSIEVRIPRPVEQREIGHLIGTLDDRIALLRETNATLEAIAQALFKSWFVDFDPVHAKQQGREPEGMDADTAALFPDSFEELGLVPRGWRVSTIDQVTSLIIDYRGKTPKKLGHDWAKSGIPAVSAKNIKRGRLVEKQAMNFVDNDLFDIWMKDKLESGDILMTSEAPLGELLYLADEHNFCLSQRVFALRANSTNCLSSFLYFWLSSKNVQEHLAARATGTTVVGIRQSELRKIEVLLPPLSIQEKANDILKTCLLRIEKNEAENETLTTLRDTLLPRLISGQLRLPDTEAMLEETT